MGAATDLLDKVWGAPSVCPPGEKSFFLVADRGIPGMVILNAAGERYANEAAPYHRFVDAGKDEDFGRGDSVYDRSYGDPTPPHPNLAPLEKGPYYAIPVHPGDIGTKGGLVTDADARVLREDGTVVEGLYASGNCSAAVMGETYPGPGATIGPAMAFGWAAAHDIVTKARAGVTGSAATSTPADA
ncbi:FAD-binding protein [Streptomyces sp. NPDC054863]